PLAIRGLCGACSIIASEDQAAFNLMKNLRHNRVGNGYQKRERKSRTAYMNDPDVIARREKALTRLAATE
ncbi:hypothetical protein, partial [Brucella anthropi]